MPEEILLVGVPDSKMHKISLGLWYKVSHYILVINVYQLRTLLPPHAV